MKKLLKLQKSQIDHIMHYPGTTIYIQFVPLDKEMESISSLHSLYLSERQASYGFIACFISLHGVTISTYINGIEYVQ